MKNQKLVELLQEHRNLPIRAMVDYDVVLDDTYSWWIGKVTECMVDSYFVDKYGRVHLKSEIEDICHVNDMEDEHFDILHTISPTTDWYAADDSEIQDAWIKVPWKMAIFLKIDGVN